MLVFDCGSGAVTKMEDGQGNTDAVASPAANLNVKAVTLMPGQKDVLGAASPARKGMGHTMGISPNRKSGISPSRKMRA